MKILIRLALIYIAVFLCSCSSDDPNHLESTLNCYFQVAPPENFSLNSEPKMRLELVDDWGIASLPASLDNMDNMIAFDENSKIFTTSFLVHRKNSKLVISLNKHPSQIFEIICPTDGIYSSDWNEWHTASWFDQTLDTAMAITKERQQESNRDFDKDESFRIRYRFEKWGSPTMK